MAPELLLPPAGECYRSRSHAEPASRQLTLSLGDSLLSQSTRNQILRLCLALLAIACLVWAQTETGQISGTVTDPTGAVVVGANVTATGVQTGTVRNTTTSSSGTYTLANLNPEDYDVTIQSGGFSTFKQRITVTVGSKLSMDAKLAVGSTGTTVQVTESAVQVNTETQTLATTVDTRQVLELPTQTRNPYDFVEISGNISPADPAGRNVGFAINGQRSSGNNILLNGVANNDEFGAGIGQMVPVDSVQEYSIITNNFTAEYGRATGGVVNLVTKSGTNEYHGSAYEFNRVSSLASNSFNNNATGTPKPIYVRNAFGFSIGGPVLPKLKNKLFFFENVEWTRIRSGSAQFAYVPTPQLLALSAPATQAYFNSLGKLRPGLVTLNTFTKANFPAPGGFCAKGAAGGPCNSLNPNTPVMNLVEWNVPSDSGGGTPQNSWSQIGRVDYNLSDKTQLFASYALSNQNFFTGTNATSPYAGFDTGSLENNQSAILSITHTFSPTFVSQSKIDFNRFVNNQPLGVQPPATTLYYGLQQAGNYSIALPGYLPFSPGSAIPFGGPQNFIQPYEDITIVKGKHDLRFGGSYTNLRDNRTFGAYENSVGTLGLNFGDSTDNLLNGDLFSFQGAINPQGKYPCPNSNVPSTITPACTVSLPVGPPSFARSLRFNEFAIYGEDSWKVTPRLTLNLGLRWEYFGPPSNENPNLMSNFYLGGGGNYIQQIANGFVTTIPNSPIHGLYSQDWGDVAPRVGFAYDVFGDGKTSFRGGYGIGYERDFGNVTFNVIQNPPNYAVISLVAGVDTPVIPITANTAGPLGGSSGTKALPKVSLRAIDQNLKTQYAHIYSASLEHQFGRNFIAGADYSGSMGERMYSIENPNRPGSGDVYLPSTYTCTPGACSARLLNTQYTNINLRTDGGQSSYNALNLRFTARNWEAAGLTLTANYTWAHAMDDLSDTFSSAANQQGRLGYTDPFNPGLDWGNSVYDIRHRIAVSAVWRIPFGKNSKGIVKYIFGGWELTPLFTANTGFPYTIYDSTNNQYTATFRAAFIGGLNTMSNVTGRPATPASLGGGPNTYTVYNISSSQVDESFLNPITGNADFGPYPSDMSGRNTFRNYGAMNLDLGLYKNFIFTERKSLQLRLESYNALNHPNFGVNVGATDIAGIGPGSPAIITGSYNGNRNVQLGAKFVF